MNLNTSNEVPVNEEFYFESDHLALKGNKDYTALLKTIVILENQRTQAIQDLDKLLLSKSKALENPVTFVAQLQNGHFLDLSRPQKIAEIPYIDWTKYNIVDADARIRPQTRHGHFTTQTSTKLEPEDKKILVRGRAFDESKPETFNQLWTNEEQRRLEQLLIEYPPENVEMKRWTKIANALGNRTPKQVSSRVQKYFIKLLRAGLPIPGRGPKFKLDIKRGFHYRYQRNRYPFFRKSTFFPHQDLVTADDSISDIVVHQQQQNLCTICGRDLIKKPSEIQNESSTKTCANCAVGELDTNSKQVSEKSKTIDSSKNYDSDYYYQNFNDSSYNYLDTNFLPD
ncbi:ZZ-type zinc finger-containing protein 3 [Chelonus insularis]|uniref:ZZ-type zinc finger-containing protein 3 n=1 Tax=Chelonus insularis TaxID=460826 RepID=UPI0015892497|nr:ZZ-type zinc finger-containing protein 3 [Chelonus insularis]